MASKRLEARDSHEVVVGHVLLGLGRKTRHTLSFHETNLKYPAQGALHSGLLYCAGSCRHHSTIAREHSHLTPAGVRGAGACCSHLTHTSSHHGQLDAVPPVGIMLVYGSRRHSSPCKDISGFPKPMLHRAIYLQVIRWDSSSCMATELSSGAYH
eukprot:1157041-Pelagomonas_calceolata.AAC.8